MKKLFLSCIALLAISVAAKADSYDLGNGITIVNEYGVTTINNENTQMCISLEIVREQQDIREHESNKVIYKVVCNKWVRRVAKEGLPGGIEYVVSAIAPQVGLPTTLIAKAVGYIYDDVCEYFEDEYGD